jgi:hypothetical protein
VAYAVPFLRVTALFDIPTDLEIAQTGVDFAFPAMALADYEQFLSPSDEDAGACLHAFESMVTASNVRWADYSRLVGLKLAVIKTDGKYAFDPFVYTDPTPASGNATDVVPQCSVVVSLWSGDTLGSGNYGRMYLPHTALDLGAAAPVATTATAAGFATQMNTALVELDDAINALPEGDIANIHPYIMTQVAGQQPKLVSKIRVGRVNDTQRRRAQNLVEDYQTTSFGG